MNTRMTAAAALILVGACNAPKPDKIASLDLCAFPDSVEGTNVADSFLAARVDSLLGEEDEAKFKLSDELVVVIRRNGPLLQFATEACSSDGRYITSTEYRFDGETLTPGLRVTSYIVPDHLAWSEFSTSMANVGIIREIMLSLDDSNRILPGRV